MVPAYNEAGTIGSTIEGLLAQTMPVDELIVVPNNCTDDTAAIAAGYPDVRVMEFPGRNPYKKAGALNWALDKLLPELHDDDRVFITDADSKLDPVCIRALWMALEDPKVGSSRSGWSLSGATKRRTSGWRSPCFQSGCTTCTAATCTGWPSG